MVLAKYFTVFVVINKVLRPMLAFIVHFLGPHRGTGVSIRLRYITRPSWGGGGGIVAITCRVFLLFNQ